MKHEFLLKLGKFWILTAILSLSTSCGKDSYSFIPSVPVYVELDLNTDLANLGIGQLLTLDSAINKTGLVNYQNSKLQNIRIGWTVYGNGLVLFRKDVSTYEAYDRTCTYQGIEKHCSVKPSIFDYICTCPCCKSVFMMNEGGIPAQGSLATASMIQYKTAVVNNKLIISK